MFADYIYEKSGAKYNKKVILIEDRGIDKTTNYSAVFIKHGFEVIKYADDLSFRVNYGERIKNHENRIVIIAQADAYIPYDIRQIFYIYKLSFSSLFPNLNAEVLRGKPLFELDMLCLAYQSSFENFQRKKQTEQYFRKKVHTKVNVKKYLHHTVGSLMAKVGISNFNIETESIEEIRSRYESGNNFDNIKIEYKDWYIIAQEKAKIDALAVRYNLDIDTSIINFRFKDYVLNRFGELSQKIDKDTPILVSKAMEYIHENSSKFVIIVMDGMSMFDWHIISESFKNIPYEETAVLAMIPTTTSISRQCLLSNKYPSQLIEPWKQSKEKSEFFSCARGFGYREEQIAFERGYEAEFDPFVKYGAVIINDVDDIVHSQKQGKLGMINDITVLADQGKLANTTRRFLDMGLDVYITSDHGNTLCTGMGKLFGTGVEIETKSRRMLVLKDFAEKDAIKEKYKLIEYPKYYLQKDYDYLLCDVGNSFDARGEEVMTHGGITIDEVIVPFIKIKAGNYNG